MADDDVAEPTPPAVYDSQLLRLVTPTQEQIAANPQRFNAITNDPAQATRMIGADGREYTVPAASAQQALNMGWTFLPHDQAQIAGHVQSMKRGALTEGISSFGNQLLMGVPEVVARANAESDPYGAGDPDYQQALQESAAEHATARMIGGGLGVLGSAIATGGIGSAIGGAAERGALGALAEAGATAGAEAVAPGLAARAIGYAARGAAEGAAYAAPQAVAQAAYGGDVQGAAESLLWGIGTGGLVGLGAGGFREAANAAGNALQGSLRGAAVQHGLIDAAGNVVPQGLEDLATSSRRQLLGLTGEGAEKLAKGDVGELEDFVRKNGLAGADSAKLASARDAAQAALDAQAAPLDKAIAAAPSAKTATLGVVPTDLAAKVSDQVLGSRPGLSTPMFAGERAGLDKIVNTIAAGGDKPLSFSDAQALRDLIGEKGGAVAQQVRDIVQSETQKAMGEAVNAVGLGDNYGSFLGAKQNLENITTLSKLAPGGLTPSGPLASLAGRIGAAPGKAIGGAIGAAGNAMGGPLGGLLGYQMGKGVAAKVIDHMATNATLDLATGALRKLGDSPESFAWIAPALAKGAVDATTSRIASAVTSLGSRAATSGGDGLKSFIGPSSTGLSKDQQYAKVEQTLIQAKADPSRVAAEAQTMGHVLAGADPQLANAVAQKQQATISYLAQALPTNGAPPQPFAPKAPAWSPDPGAKQAFLDKLEIAQDPARALEHARDGSLTQAHVDALTALYPSMKAQMVGEISKAAYGPKAPALSEGVKHGLSMLTGVPLTNPQRINYQGAYQQAQSSHGPNPTKGSPKGSRAPKMDHLPSYSTPTQQRADR